MKTILIANRGEIAVRIMRACREMGIGTVAIYSDVDREARHVRYADRAFPLIGNAPADTYLRIDKILEIARHAGADAVHPGYGFLAENEDFAQACVDAGLTFIGPSPAVIARMGSKTAARACAMAAGAPVVPGTETPLAADVRRRRSAATGRCGRLSADGQGRRRRRWQGHARGPQPRRTARRRPRALGPKRSAHSAMRPCTSNGASLRPRHVEIQLLADQHGTVLPFVERECSVQRRHQKVIEESPAPRMSLALRQPHGRRRRVGRARRRVHQRRHDRVPGRCRRRVLFPRDEHPAAGRASGHRDGDRRRPRAVADPHRPRRAPHRVARRRRSRRADTPSSAASTPRIRTSASCLGPGASPR